MDRKVQHTYNGSLTVEAVFLLPIILILLFLILEINFYLHDICVTQSYCDTVSSRIANRLQKEETKQDTSLYEKNLGEKLFCTRVDGFDVNTTITEVTVCCKIQRRAPYGFLFLFTQRKGRIIESKSAIFDPVTSLRYQRLVVSEVEKTKAFETIVSFLKKAFLD